MPLKVLEKRRAHNQNYYHQIKSDPNKWAAHRVKQREARLRRRQNPTYIVAECEAARKRYQDPTFKVKRHEAYKRRRQDPTCIAADREAGKKRWKESGACRKKAVCGNPATWPRHIIPTLKARAKRLGVCFDLVAADIVVPDKCPILNVPFAWGGGAHHPNGPSVDRVIPALGYVKGNVRVISRRANRIKQDVVDPEIFRRLLEYVSNQKDSIESTPEALVSSAR